MGPIGQAPGSPMTGRRLRQGTTPCSWRTRRSRRSSRPPPGSGVHRYTFPATDQPAVFLDLGYGMNWDAPVRDQHQGGERHPGHGLSVLPGVGQGPEALLRPGLLPAGAVRGLCRLHDAPGCSGSEARVAAGDVRATSSALRALFAFDPTAAGDRTPSEGRALLCGRGGSPGQPGSGSS